MRISWTLAAVLAACAPAGPGNPAQDTGGFWDTSASDNGDFLVSYLPTADPYYDAWRTYMVDVGVFEQNAAWVNGTYALPYDAGVVFGECGLANAFWSSDDRQLSMCYELIWDVQDAFANAGLGLTEEQVSNATLNTYQWVFFHEVGHALIDMLDLPSTGREEDAVDQFSTLLFIASGVGFAAVDASLYFYIRDTGAAAPTALADEHSLNMQRFYNVLCLVYGSDTATYGYLIDAFPEMAARADRCPGEFEDAGDAWTRLLEPYEL